MPNSLRSLARHPGDSPVLITAVVDGAKPNARLATRSYFSQRFARLNVRDITAGWILASRTYGPVPFKKSPTNDRTGSMLVAVRRRVMCRAVNDQK